MRIFIYILLLTATSCAMYGQYNITSNAKCVAALNEKSQKGDPSIHTAISFLEALKTGQPKQWWPLLSEGLQKQNKDSTHIGELWDYLSSKNIICQLIAEQPVQRDNIKALYFKTTSNNLPEKLIKVMLIKEKHEWKVQSIEL